MKGENRNYPEKPSTSLSHPAIAYTWTPRADVFESENGAMLLVDMPGVDDKSLDIRVERNVLTISGHTAGLQADNRNLRQREFGAGTYRRVFNLSDELDADGIEGIVKNGVLRLSIPKASMAKSRKVEVKTS